MWKRAPESRRAFDLKATIWPPLRELGHISSERIGVRLGCRLTSGNLPRLGARREWRAPFCDLLLPLLRPCVTARSVFAHRGGLAQFVIFALESGVENFAGIFVK